MEKVTSGKRKVFKGNKVIDKPLKKERGKASSKKKVKKKIKFTPIPWLVPKAIEALENHIKDYGDQTIKVLEFGSGGSSLWFLNHNKILLTTIEHQKKYADALTNEITDPDKLNRILLFLESRPYADVALNPLINEMFGDEKFDIILIDGRDRVKCAKVAKQLIAPEGMIMLDNSERKKYAPIFELFSEWDVHSSARKWETTWWFAHEEGAYA